MCNDNFKNIPIDVPFDPLSEDLIVDIMLAIDKKVIRRFGAVLNHNKAGYSYNVMLVWKVPEEVIDEIGKRISEHKFISHCYRRAPAAEWPYNLYAMMHARNEDEGKDLITKLKNNVEQIAPGSPFQALKTITEFKKSSFLP